MGFYYYHYSSPLGVIIIESDGNSLTGLHFHDQKHFNYLSLKEGQEVMLPIFEETISWLDIYFSKDKPNFVPSLGYKGTPFQERVWERLLKIPYGEYTTYGRIAEEIALEKGILKMSSQAIGNAISLNPISIIIPCHRVLGKNGELKGYDGSIWRKIALLEIEKTEFNING